VFGTEEGHFNVYNVNDNIIEDEIIDDFKRIFTQQFSSIRNPTQDPRVYKFITPICKHSFYNFALTNFCLF
jgi:hypothetical protein